MDQARPGQGGRVLGRSLLTLANVITAVAPIAADWNDSHVFNERWPGHARFHGVTALTMTTALSSANIWSLWSGDGDQARAGFFAAAVPVAYWSPFFLAPLVPGTTVADPLHPGGTGGRHAGQPAGRGSHLRDGGGRLVHRPPFRPRGERPHRERRGAGRHP